MTFKTFFFILFVFSTLISVLFSFFTYEMEILRVELELEFKTNPVFISLATFIIAILSYVGLVISHYILKKKQEAKAKKIEEERKSLAKIHQELKAIREGISI